MVHDPDCTGDTLLLGLCMLTLIEDRRTQGRRKFRSGWVGELEELARGDDLVCGWRAPAQRGGWVRMVFRKDVPRYEVEYGPVVCEVPMVRRDGPCGKPTTQHVMDRDPVTGEGRWVGYCARHRTGERMALHEARRQQWITNGTPHPPPNRGGVLARYFTASWAELYRWADPGAVPATSAKPATPPRPQLRLIVNDPEQEGEQG
jgi:hypothetical protein